MAEFSSAAGISTGATVLGIMLKIHTSAFTLGHVSKTLADAYIADLIIPADVATTATVVCIVVGIRTSSPAVTKAKMGASQTLPAFPLDTALAFGASIRALAAMIRIALQVDA